eukprot:2864206-Amphidinium_carterae.1
MGSDGCALRLHLYLSVSRISRRLLEGDVLLSGFSHFRVILVVVQFIVENCLDVGNTFSEFLADELPIVQVVCGSFPHCVPYRTSNS